MTPTVEQSDLREQGARGPAIIFLEPPCDGYAHEGRQWCEDDVWDEGGVTYIRSDIAALEAAQVDAMRSRIERLEEALREVARMPEQPDLGPAGARDYIRYVHASKAGVLEAKQHIARAALGDDG